MRRDRISRIVLVLMAAVALATGSAGAAQLYVGSFVIAETPGDGKCGLGEAIRAVNMQMSVDACPAGDGADDRIYLRAGTYEVHHTLRFERPVELIGAGSSRTVLRAGSDPSVPFSPSPPAENPWGDCAVYGFSPGKYITLKNLTLFQDPSAHLRGACTSAGLFALEGARVTGFTVRGVDAREDASGNSVLLFVTRSSIDGNRSPGDGAGVYFSASTSTDHGNPAGNFTIDQSSIVNNVSEGSGGGVYVDSTAFGGNYNIVNSTISGNRATRNGGGILDNITATDSNAVYLLIAGSTIAFNRAGGTGGGIHKLSNTLTDLAIGSSIVTGNLADGDPQQANLNLDFGANVRCEASSLVHLAGPAWTADRLPVNVAAPDLCRFDVADAFLGGLAPGGAAGSPVVHRLLPGSPAIDALSVSSLSVDQRGLARPQGSGYDVGAVESDPRPRLVLPPRPRAFSGWPAPRKWPGVHPGVRMLQRR